MTATTSIPADAGPGRPAPVRPPRRRWPFALAAALVLALLGGAAYVAAGTAVLAVPDVAAASVSRHWPHDLRIIVTTRVPIAVTKANGAFWLLDAAGLPYRKVGSSTAPAGLLAIDLATPGVKDPATLAGLAVISQLTVPFRQSVASVSAPSPYAVVLRLRDGRTVRWGGSDQGAKKMQILPAVLAQPGSTYDISDPGLVTVH